MSTREYVYKIVDGRNFLKYNRIIENDVFTISIAYNRKVFKERTPVNICLYEEIYE